MTTRIRGTALAPGVSKNGRYYSPDMIRAAVEQAQPRVRAGQMLMKAHHGAADTLGYVGRITSLRAAEDGSAQFEAELADTSTARDVAKLIRGSRPFVNSVSIAGCWTGKVRRVSIGAQSAETAEGLELFSVDFTATPGVDAARFTTESAHGTRYIYEQAPEPVEPVTAEPDSRELAAMPLEEFLAHASGQWAAAFGAMDESRASGLSPFWRGLGA